MEKLAKIYIIEEYQKDEVELTTHGTEYRYATIRIEYLIEYINLEQSFVPETTIVKDVKLSTTMFSRISKGEIFVIQTDKLEDSSFFNDFTNTFVDFENVPIFKDKFISDIKGTANFLIGQTEEGFHKDPNDKSNNQENETELDLINKTKLFLSTLKKADSFLDELDSKINFSDQLFYDVYDVNGYLSILTNDIDFEFYFDIGDLSNKFSPKQLNPFGIFISHYHLDHYNLLNTYMYEANHYILPYSASIKYKGKVFFSSNQIQFITSNLSKVIIVIHGSPTPPRKRNEYSKTITTKFIKFFLPKHTSIKDANLESVAIEFTDLKQSVFYPGDTKNYMYFSFMKDYDFFIASHHGGDVGTLNFNKHIPKNVLINTCTLNDKSLCYINNQKFYKSKSWNLIIHKNYNGNLGTRIRLK